VSLKLADLEAKYKGLIIRPLYGIDWLKQEC